MEESRGLRRSARLSALDTCKTNKTTHNVGPVGVARGRGGKRRDKTGARDRRETSSSSRRGRKRKSSAGALEEATFSSVEEDALAEEHDDSSSYNMGKNLLSSPPLNLPVGLTGARQSDVHMYLVNSLAGNSSRSGSWLPEKQVLELILDSLQKRDLHEIFAKPVDPKKVEDYYEVIQNPVDFGKIREKLQAGMYESLKQFEVVFFRSFKFPAHSLLDLAKRIFHALKTNPSNFESEVLSMRPKRGRPSKSSHRGGILLSEGEPARTGNDNNNIAAVDISRGRHRSSMNGAYGLLKEKMAESSTIMLGPSPRLNRRTANDDFSGLGYGHKYISSEIEPRDTYMPISSNSPHFRPLIYPADLIQAVGQCNVGYIDSLARFTSDLGPSAQMIALKRLRGMSEKQAVSPHSTAPPMLQQQQGSAPCTSTAAADHAGKSSCRPPHGRIEIPPSVYCPPRFGIPDESHHDAAAASLNHAFGSMIRTTSAGSLNPMSEKALISRHPPAATSSIHAFRSETPPPPPPGSSCMRLPSTSQQQQAATLNNGDLDDPSTSSALRNITYSRRHARSDVLPALGGSFIPAADQTRKPSFSQLPAASQFSPISPNPNPLFAYNSINDGSWSSFPAAQMNPIVEAANYSFTDFLDAAHTRNENLPAPAAAAIPNSGNNVYMAMLAAASAMSPSGMQQLRLSTGDPESDLGGQSKLLELVSRNNNPTLLPLMLPASTTPPSASAQVTNLLPDHLDGGEKNQGGVAAGGLMMSSHDQGLSLGQSSAWGQANVGMHDMMSSLGQQFSRVGEMDYSLRLDGFSNSLLQLPDRGLPETLFLNAMGGGDRVSCHGRRQFDPTVNPPLSDTTQPPDLALQL
ncbi:hypothetical protein ACLOJK_012304 [Asimina triloba]